MAKHLTLLYNSSLQAAHAQAHANPMSLGTAAPAPSKKSLAAVPDFPSSNQTLEALVPVVYNPIRPCVPEFMLHEWPEQEAVTAAAEENRLTHTTPLLKALQELMPSAFLVPKGQSSLSRVAASKLNIRKASMKSKAPQSQYHTPPEAWIATYSFVLPRQFAVAEVAAKLGEAIAKGAPIPASVAEPEPPAGSTVVRGALVGEKVIRAALRTALMLELENAGVHTPIRQSSGLLNMTDSKQPASSTPGNASFRTQNSAQGIGGEGAAYAILQMGRNQLKKLEEKGPWMYSSTILDINWRETGGGNTGFGNEWMEGAAALIEAQAHAAELIQQIGPVQALRIEGVQGWIQSYMNAVVVAEVAVTRCSELLKPLKLPGPMKDGMQQNLEQLRSSIKVIGTALSDLNGSLGSMEDRRIWGSSAAAAAARRAKGNVLCEWGQEEEERYSSASEGGWKGSLEGEGLCPVWSKPATVMAMAPLTLRMKVFMNSKPATSQRS